MKKTLDIPTQPRNQREERLLDEIMSDPSLQNADVRGRVRDYMNHNHHYALAAWIHSSASMIRYSFENEKLVMNTYRSYNNQKPTPRIIGIKTWQDINY